MKLFQRTLLFFASVILFQAVLVVFLVTRIVDRNNLTEARVELRSEAERAYEGFNAWKRVLWKNLIRLSEEYGQSPSGEDGRESHPVRPGGSPLPEADALGATLERLFSLSGYDFLFYRNSLQTWSRVLRLAPALYTFPDRLTLAHQAAHPYLRIELMDRELYLVGSVRLFSPGSPDEDIEVYFVKRITSDLLNPGGMPTRALVSLVLGSWMPVGLLPEESAVRLARLDDMRSSYRELYGTEIGRDRFNAAVWKLGKVNGDTGAHDLFLVTALSTAPYEARISLISRTVLSASLLCALLSAVMSLFFSRNISSPVNRLAAAMRRVRDGNYDTVVPLSSPGRSADEMAELLSGFNDMAATIHQDRLTMSEYIDEIVFLKDYNEKIIHSIRTGIAIIGTGLVFRKTNQCFLDLLGLSEPELVERPVEETGIEILDETVRVQMAEILSGASASYRALKRSGAKNVFELRLYPMSEPENGGRTVSGCILTIDDISSKVELEEKIFLAEKLSSISMLSAGVAHEINNPLSSIMTNVQNLLAEETDREKAVSLRYIEQETRRIAGIVRDLLDFSSRDRNAVSECSLNDAVREIVRLVRYSLPADSGVNLRTRLSRDLPPARIGKDEFKQVIINLVKNAVQALEGAGSVLISTSRAAEAGRLLVRVEDSGVGIRPEDIPYIFDPFFTTKKNGEGTGLGLSVVYGIMNKYGGSVRVKSRRGVRTTFTLEIPGCLEEFSARQAVPGDAHG